MDYRHAIERLVGAIDDAVERSFPERRRIYIANAHAGTRHRHNRTVSVAAKIPRRENSAARSLFWTDRAEQAVSVVRGLLESPEVAAAKPVVVSLGGDGTHNHCLRTGMESPEGCTFLRVPLGSGNDGGTTASLHEFLTLLEQPLRDRYIPALEVYRQGNPAVPMVAAFNIASVGIDAFITAMHDKWRTILPGNTYRLLVNLAVLRYERLVKLGPSRLVLKHSAGNDSSDTIDDGFRPRILVAMGVSGYRTYGDHMWVLPGNENVCVLGTAGLRDKFRMKRLFYAGLHVNEPLTTMYQAREVTIEYDRPVPLQTDGEAVWLNRNDFPLTMKVREGAVSVIDPE